MVLDLAGRTHVGLKRSENQDEVFVQEVEHGASKIAILAVADGMGGHQRGREASQNAIASVRDRFSSLLSNHSDRPSEEWCRHLETGAHAAVTGQSEADGISGTTLTIAVLFGSECFIGQVGDSRAYLSRDGKLDQVTEDQTWEAHAEKHGVENLYGKALKQAIGVGKEVEPDTYQFEFRPSDWLLLCSDGLYKMASSDQIQAELGQAAGAEDACNRLINLALGAGGRDNIAVCVARIGKPKTPVKKPDRRLMLAIFAVLILTVLLILAVTGKIS
jgi:PPM family protein phosphatase